MKTFVTFCLGLALASLPAHAQDRARPPSNARPHPDVTAPDPFGRFRLNGRVFVGESAPDFELTASDGHNVGLSRLRGEWVLLRFADSRREFDDLATWKDELDQMGVRLLAICGDKPQTLRAYVQRNRLPFEILSDASGEVSAIYGFYDATTNTGRTGVVIIDRRGIVRLALQGGAPADQMVALTRYTLTGGIPQP